MKIKKLGRDSFNRQAVEILVALKKMGTEVCLAHNTIMGRGQREAEGKEMDSASNLSSVCAHFFLFPFCPLFSPFLVSADT